MRRAGAGQRSHTPQLGLEWGAASGGRPELLLAVEERLLLQRAEDLGRADRVAFALRHRALLEARLARRFLVGRAHEGSRIGCRGRRRKRCQLRCGRGRGRGRQGGARSGGAHRLGGVEQLGEALFGGLPANRAIGRPHWVGHVARPRASHVQRVHHLRQVLEGAAGGRGLAERGEFGVDLAVVGFGHEELDLVAAHALHPC